MSVSFHADEPGLDHQAKMPDVPKPEALPTEAEIKRAHPAAMPEPVRRYYERERPIELRPVEFERYLGKKIEDGRFNVWIRATGRAAGRPGDPPMRARLCVRHDAARHRADAARPHACSRRTFMAASLDHALWFHRPFRADEWLLYSQDSPNMHGARGFSRGLIFTADGTLVASVAQEGLLRERRPQVKPGLNWRGCRHLPAIRQQPRLIFGRIADIVRRLARRKTMAAACRCLSGGQPPAVPTRG